MKLRNIALSSIVALGSLSLSAQETKTEYVFNPHWYGQLQIGGQYTIGEISFSDLLSPNAQIAGGYQFTPVVGARLSVNAWQSKAGVKSWTTKGENGLPVSSPYEADWKWNYVAPMVDATFNLSNLFCGFNPNRLVNVGVMAGIGANIGFSNDEAADVSKAVAGRHSNAENFEYLWDGTKIRLAARLGATVDFRLTDRLNLGLELQANTLNDHYNSKRAGNSDWYFNALVGVKYAFGKTHTTRTVAPMAPIERVVERIVEKQVPAPAPVVKPEEKTCCQEKAEPLRRDIFFTINSNKIVGDNVQKVKDVADYLAKNPNAKVTVTGYADKGTGNNAINDRLAAKRAQIVVDELVNKYGVSRSRITSESKGSRVQPFAENSQNRVTICIAE